MHGRRVWPVHPAMSAPDTVQVNSPAGSLRVVGIHAWCRALHFTAASQLLAIGQSYPSPKAAHCVRPAQVPAKDIEAWDSAHEGAASEAARKAQTRRAASAKHGNAWLLLEFMDRGCLQARRPRAAARPRARKLTRKLSRTGRRSRRVVVFEAA